MAVPNPVRLFHITAIANLPAICATGALLAKNAGAAAGIGYQNIAHAGAQSARAGKRVPSPPGGQIHDYVPFYFAPRSPMLMAIHGGRVSGCDLKQEDIVHFQTSVVRVIAEGALYVFYDRNATLAFSEAFCDVAHLESAVAWDLLTEAPTLDGYCKYWQSVLNIPRYADRMERRQAEFLIRQSVPLGAISRIGVANETKAQIVRGILAAAQVPLPVEVKTDWYFLGQ